MWNQHRFYNSSSCMRSSSSSSSSSREREGVVTYMSERLDGRAHLIADDTEQLRVSTIHEMNR